MLLYLKQRMVYLKGNFETYKINSIYNYEKINSLFKNFDTMSFIDLLVRYDYLKQNGYNESFKSKLTFHTFTSLFFFSNDRISVNFNNEYIKKI